MLVLLSVALVLIAVMLIALILMMSGAQAAGSRMAGAIRLAQTADAPALVISVPAIIAAEPAQVTPFPIQFRNVDVQKLAFVLLLKGLPPAVSLTEGHAVAPGTWLVNIAHAARLAISVPVGTAPNILPRPPPRALPS